MSAVDDLLACERCTTIVDRFADLQEAADGALVCEPCLDAESGDDDQVVLVALASVERCTLCRGIGVIGSRLTFTHGPEEIRCTRCGGSGALAVPA